MKFKTLSMLLTLVAALCLIGCTKDPEMNGSENGQEGQDSGRTVFMSAGISLPTTGTRSQTDNYDPDDTTNSDPNDKTNSDRDKDEDDPQSDFENGYDYESDIRTMILVFADKDGKYITHTVVSSIAESREVDYVVNGEIKYDDLKKAYGTSGTLTDTEVTLWAYCNYTARLLDLFTQYHDDIAKETDQSDPKISRLEWLDWNGEVLEEGSSAGNTPLISNTIWAKRSFLMTNARQVTSKFPENLSDWDEYTDKSNPYKLTPDGDQKKSPLAFAAIPVERAAARIDFRGLAKATNGASDSEVDAYADNAGKQFYKLWRTEVRTTTTTTAGDPDTPGSTGSTTTKTERKKVNLFNVQLTRMSLVNMSKHFYYVRRVSDTGEGLGTPALTGTTGTDPKNFEVAGREYYKKGTPGTDGTATKATYNYVVDTDYATKRDKYNASNASGVPGSEATTGFNFPLFTTGSTETNPVYNYTSSTWYSDNIEDVLKGEDDTWSGSTSDRYHIWRYVTENTIPQDETAAVTGEYENNLQIAVQSTGIIFKGAIMAGNDVKKGFDDLEDSADPFVSKKVQEALENSAKHTEGKTDEKPDGYDYPILFNVQQDNMLYAGLKDLVYASVADGVGGTVYMATDDILDQYELVATTGSDGKKVFAEAPQPATRAEDPQPEEPQKLTIEIAYNIFEYQKALAAAEKDASGSFDAATFAEEYQKKHKLPNDYFTYEIKYSDEKIANQFAAANGLTVYVASDEKDGEGWGYYCYYFYWNRHNDNGRSGKMGPMEFATVRNNVYKLSVSKINAFGHPRNTTYDPDPITPETPDEDPKAYFQVQVEVLPWVVRVNEIEF